MTIGMLFINLFFPPLFLFVIVCHVSYFIAFLFYFKGPTSFLMKNEITKWFVISDEQDEIS
jgi:hypothetical protein